MKTIVVLPGGEEHYLAAVTDPQGRYRIQGAPIGRVEIKAYASGTDETPTPACGDAGVVESLFFSRGRLTVRRYRWEIWAVSLLTTHYHVVHSTCERLSNGMQWLNGRYAQDFNRRHGRRATCSAIGSAPG